MTIRFFLFGIFWLAAMILLFTTPTYEPTIFFEYVPSRSIVNFFLFWGLVHIWSGACKRQIRFEWLRNNSGIVVLSSAIGIALISEMIIYLSNIAPGIGLWNLAFDITGAFFGLVSFRLLYRTCY